MRYVRYFFVLMAFFLTLGSLFLPYVKNLVFVDSLYPILANEFGYQMILPIISAILSLIICTMVIAGKFGRMIIIGIAMTNLMLYGIIYADIHNNTFEFGRYGALRNIELSLGYYVGFNSGIVMFLMSIVRSGSKKPESESDLLDDEI